MNEDLAATDSMQEVLTAIIRERKAQDDKWGEQNHPDGTYATEISKFDADTARELCDIRFKAGEGAWADIAREEFYEALAEDDPALLRAELIQCAAVFTAWIEAIDRRAATPSTEIDYLMPLMGGPGPLDSLRELMGHQNGGGSDASTDQKERGEK
jgi:hypothetical protein